MKLLVFFSLMLISIEANCQALLIITDKLTGEVRKETTWERFSHRTRPGYSVKSDFRIVKYNDTSMFLDLKMSIQGKEMPIREGNKLAIYFKDVDSPLILICVENSSANARSGNGEHVYPRYKLTGQGIDLLMKNDYNHLILQSANQSYEDDNDRAVRNNLKNASAAIQTGKWANGNDAPTKYKAR